MTRLKFKCELLSDVILNQKAASEGPNKTLDFIPGSNFFGIVANQLYPKETTEKYDNIIWEILHSGKVRFGDAHPSQANTNTRGLKVPASMYHPKLKNQGDVVYIHHYANHNDNRIRNLQLKQYRNGFYDFSSVEAKLIKTETNYAIKSAHDKNQRRSLDEAMYGYESLQKGLTLYFEVECEDAHKEIIVNALEGKKHIGRSRNAQYGLVKISRHEYNDIPSRPSKGKFIEVYADGRLIFLDDNGLPTFHPKPEQLGIEGGIINWSLSQIRTFQYSPWNFKRQCFDTDRCGIEKGSVFVIEGGICQAESRYVGAYKSEGFGKVIYNPSFLEGDENGLAITSFEKKQNSSQFTAEQIKERTKKEIQELKKEGGLLSYLGKQKEREQEDITIYEQVSAFVEDKNRGGLFTRSKEKFASQWGSIRSIAMSSKTYDNLYINLFGEGRLGYLTHGKALEKWEDNKKVNVVKEFVEYFGKNGLKHCACRAVVNLAAEMSKEMTRSVNKEYKEGK